LKLQFCEWSVGGSVAICAQRALSDRQCTPSGSGNLTSRACRLSLNCPYWSITLKWYSDGVPSRQSSTFNRLAFWKLSVIA